MKQNMFNGVKGGMNEMIKGYQFKGHSYHELIECFELNQKQLRYGYKIADIGEASLDFRPLVEETVEKIIYVNGNKITFTLSDQEDVELEKLRQFLWKNSGNFEVIERVRVFLELLTEESEKNDSKYSAFNGILETDDDEMFMYWVVSIIEDLWT